MWLYLVIFLVVAAIFLLDAGEEGK